MSMWDLHEEINFAYDDGFIGEAEDIKEFKFLEGRLAVDRHFETIKKNIKNLLEYCKNKNITSGKIIKAINNLKEYYAWDVDYHNPYTKEDEDEIKKNYKRVISYLTKHNFIPKKEN